MMKDYFMFKVPFSPFLLTLQQVLEKVLEVWKNWRLKGAWKSSTKKGKLEMTPRFRYQKASSVYDLSLYSFLWPKGDIFH